MKLANLIRSYNFENLNSPICPSCYHILLEDTEREGVYWCGNEMCLEEGIFDVDGLYLEDEHLTE